MGHGAAFRKIFQTWPEKLPRRGILVDSFNEATPFKGFLLSAEFVALERTNPDALGARIILMPYDNIANLKFVDPLRSEDLKPFGCEGKFSQG